MAASHLSARNGSRRRVLWPIFVMIAAALLAACGSGGSTATPEADDTLEEGGESPATDDGGGESGSTEQASDEPFRIGASISQTGNFAAPATGMREGFELWVDMINEQGGLLGRPVEFIIHDDESNADLARQLAERLVQQDEIDVLFGPYSSGLSAVMGVVSEREGVPLFAGTASDGSIWEEREFDWTYQTTIDSAFDVYGFMQVAADQGAETVVIVRDASSSPHLRSGTFAEEHAAEAGLEVLDVIEFESEDRDFSSIVERLAELQPDVVAQTGYDAVSVEIINGLSARGIQLDGYFSSLAALPSVSEPVGDAIEGVMGRTPWHPALDTHGNQEFIDAYNEKHPDGELNYHVAMAYAVGQVLQGAVEGSGSTDPEVFTDYAENNPIPTVIGENEYGDNLSNEGYSAFLTQWQDGEEQVIWPTDLATSDVVWPKPQW